MALSVTVVHRPDALPQRLWQRLRHQAPGDHDHELRLILDGGHSPSGAELAQALSRWIRNTLADTPPRPLDLRVAGAQLAEIPSGSAQIHHGMVVLLTPKSTTASASSAGPLGLRLCVDQGPDAGAVFPLPRGIHELGRAAPRLRITDPALARHHLSLDVGARAVQIQQNTRGKARRTSRPWSAQDPLRVGSSTLRLFNGSAPVPPRTPWPVAAEPVSEKPPEGRHRMMLLMAMVPLVIGIVLVTVTGMWFFLLFSAVSGLVALATVIDARRRRRVFSAAIAAAAAQWSRRLEQAAATPGQLGLAAQQARGRPSGLGAGAPGRRSDEAPFRAVRCGTGVITPELTLPSGVEMPRDTVVRAPIILGTGPEAVTEIGGPRRAVMRTARWILTQLLIRPAEERATVLLAGAHAASLVEAELRDFAELHRAVTADDIDVSSDDTVTPVLVLSLNDLPEGDITASALDRQTQHALARGWHVLILAPDGSIGPPPRCTASVRIDLSSDTLQVRDTSGTWITDAEEVAADGISSSTAAQMLRRSLPSCTDLRGSGGIPAQVQEPLPERLMTGCATTALEAPLGTSAAGPEQLNLVDDGPHILIAGTSGSGKSELLKGLLLGWAARYSPDELNFMLFDFKGGSTFRQLAALEHSLGLVTDLSQAQAERTLEGIRSELTRRERLFFDAGADDYSDYRRQHPELALPRILVVIDEFRIFSHELPETMDELMRLATLGRSLGLHLVLSTQRPQGVVTADIRANIGAVVALRLRSTDESQELVGAPTAGEISRHLPGRAVLARPGEPPVLFQGALPAPSRQELAVTTLREGAHRRPGAATAASVVPEEGDTAGGATAPDQVRTASTAAYDQLIEEIAQSTVTRSHTPVLPPLPAELFADERPQIPGAVIGRVDRPSRQEQQDLLFDPTTSTSLGLIGEGSSGGREAVVAIAHQLLSSPAPCHLYLFDGDDSFTRFAGHRRIGALLGEEHLAEVDHLLLRLKDELTRRRSHPGPHIPLVVLMSGHAQWHALSTSFGASSMDHLLGTLIAEGHEAGITVIISGGRELASGKLGARLPRRIYLPFGVSQDTRFLWPKMRQIDAAPGRGIHLSPEEPATGSEIQLTTAPAEAPDETCAAAQHGPALTVRPLPENLPWEAIPGAASHVSAGDEILLGVRQFSLTTATATLHGILLVLGTAGTGKSNALHLIGHQRSDALWVTPTTPVPSSLDAAPTLVLVDDADQCAPEHHRLIEQCIGAGAAVVATAAPTPALWSRLPWSHHARTSGEHMLLSPTQRSHSDVFATPVPLVDRPVPGRAVHLRTTGPEMIQWARAPEA